MQRLLRILDDLRGRRKNAERYRSKETEDAEHAFLSQRHRKLEGAGKVADPATLPIIDEAGWLRMAGLEGGIGMIAAPDRTRPRNQRATRSDEGSCGSGSQESLAIGEAGGSAS